MRADVVVIGGGVIGCATAYYLAGRGQRVVLVEAHELASGASRACDGFIILQSKQPGLHLELALESRREYERLRRDYGDALELRTDGGYIVVETPAQWEVMEELVSRQLSGGLKVELLGRDQALRSQPALSRHVTGATYCALDAQVNPMQVCFTLARAAVDRGATVQEHTRVTGFQVAGGALRAVLTDRGPIATGAAVVAAGVETPTLLGPLGVEAPIRPRRGQIVVSERVPRLLAGVMLCARYLTAKYRPELLPDDGAPERLGVGLALEQTEAGNILISSTREFVGFDRRTTLEGITAIVRHALRLVPALEHVAIIRTFAGLRPYTPDGLPLLGPLPGISGLWVASGHEGDGIALAPITGRLMAALITGERPGVDLTPLAVDRFRVDSSA